MSISCVLYVLVLYHLQKKNLFIVIKNESFYFYALRLIIKLKTNIIIFKKAYYYYYFFFRMVLVMLMIFGKLMWMEVNQVIL